MATGTEVPAQPDIAQVHLDALAAKVAANRAALDALAAEARTFAKGDGALTAAALTIVLRKQAEMLARMHFDIRYGDE